MGEAKHTPTPWKANGFMVVAPESADRRSSMYGGRGVAHTGNYGDGPPVECEANAEFIVRAVNCHDELVDALESAKAGLLAALRCCAQAPAEMEVAEQALGIVGVLLLKLKGGEP